MNSRIHFTRVLVGMAAALIAVPTIAMADCGVDHGKASTEKAGAEKTPSIVEIAAGNEDFSTLVAAVKAAGLLETLQGEGPFTVFAPTNEAFAALPEGTVESLLKPENKDQLIAILTYHVVPGKVMSKDVVKLKKAKTVQGQNVTIEVTKKKKVMIDQATVVTADIEASNGVIHVIDAVILPKTEKAGE